MDMENDDFKPSADVIVIGAGIAGLAAARILAEAGNSILLIEASDRIGGRIRSQAVAGFSEPVELGAEFVHGLPEDLLQLLHEAGLETYELTGRSYSWDGSSLSPDDEDEAEEDPDVLEDLEGVSRRDAAQDVSFADYVKKRNIATPARERILNYVEGFNAADATRISTQALAYQQEAEDAIGGDRLFHVRRGYSALIEYVSAKCKAAGGRILLEHSVDRIRWSRDTVTVIGTDSKGEKVSLESRRLILAVPLGVLQSGSIAIEPWPASLDAMQQLAMGPVHRISLVFKERFWARPAYEADDLSFLFARRVTPSVWWSAQPSDLPVLTGWIGGARVRETAAADLLETTLASLSHIFQLARPELDALLLSTHSHDWNDDPLSRGAYSYVCTGGIDASSTLSMPIERTLFIAGEHTDVSGHWGTVHGALRSGVRAAGQVIDSFRSNDSISIDDPLL